jgi:hypothetical protein
MKRHAASLVVLAAVTATLTTIGFAAAGAAIAAPGASAGVSSGGSYSPGLPQHVFAPYVETYDTSAGPAALAQESGARYLSLAFLETALAGSCTAYWNGDTSEPISQASFGSDIAAIQAAGGNVIPSFR